MVEFRFPFRFQNGSRFYFCVTIQFLMAIVGYINTFWVLPGQGHQLAARDRQKLILGASRGH